MKPFKSIIRPGILLLLAAFHQPVTAQPGGALRWLRVGELHGFYSEQGVENFEMGRPGWVCNYGNAWPASYSMLGSTLTHRNFMIGCRNYYDPVLKKQMAFRVNSHPYDGDWDLQRFPAGFKMTGRFDHPVVVVDGLGASENQIWDEVDEIDEAQAADRMITSVINTSIGVTVTRKIMAFGQQNNDNYYIYDFTFKNTGIIDGSGTVYEQAIRDMYFLTTYRWCLSGESVPANGEGWGTWNSTWGRNIVNQVIGTNPGAPDFEMRGMYSWYGPHSQRPPDDWGCPNEKADLTDDIPDEVMAAAKFVGAVTIHADMGPGDPSDDPFQPASTGFIGSDNMLFRTFNQYDEMQCQRQWEFMAAGHPPKTHAELVGDQFADTYGDDAGGYMQTHGFGPYTLAPGDSVHIVIAEAVAGISREKNREVTRNWLTWKKGAGQPKLVLPDGSETTDFDKYKHDWVWTCDDSMLQTFRRAIECYRNGYSVIQPPPPPKTFEVISGGDRIKLVWADNAAEDPHFNGYRIYRSEGSVANALTVYEKLFECDASNAVHSFDDITALRGRDYYYYIVSKDDGTRNLERPGVPLVSSKFYTMTNKPARLRRPAKENIEDIRVVPNPYVLSKRALQFGEVRGYDRIAFYGLPGVCTIRVFTESGTLIWTKKHDDGSGDELWESLTSSGQVIVSGIYIAHFETPDGRTTYRKLLVIR
jgi:hypothetical protein